MMNQDKPGTRSDSGHRDETGDGIVLHMAIRAGFAQSVLCGRKAARQATTKRADVNCKPCMERLAQIGRR